MSAASEQSEPLSEPPGQACVDLLDYGGGNTGSVIRCLERLEISFNRVRTPEQLSGDRPLILPGVGAFGATMESLQTKELAEPLCDIVRSGTPFLGICVGLQVLFESSVESPGVAGLGLMRGKIERFSGQDGLKVPQMGWNRIQPVNRPGAPEGYVYFVNAFYAVPEDPATVLYKADYGGPFCAAVQQDNITAFQFHPEKSGLFGHDLVKRWMDAL